MIEIPAYTYDYADDHHMMDWWGTSYMGIWIIGLLVFSVLIIFLVLYLVLRDERPKQIHQVKYAPAILDERYAQGELTRDEYFQIRNDLTEIKEVDFRRKVRK